MNRILKIIGLIGIISYLIVILYNWIDISLQGQTYFRAGEPILIIKYIEWVLGIVGIFTAINYLIEELKSWILSIV